MRLGLWDIHNDPVIKYFKLKLVKEDDWGTGYYWYARTDSIWLYWSWLLWLQNKLYEKGMWVKVRIILTLEIWGLGYTEQGSIYEWKNIFHKRKW